MTLEKDYPTDAAITDYARRVSHINRLAGRNDRQKEIVAWSKREFGEVEATDPRQRAIRLLEEAIELYQAVDGDAGQAHKLVDYVFGRPKGEVTQEIGGVSVCLLIMAESVHMSADACEVHEVVRVLDKPPGHFAKRNANKNAAGFLATRRADVDFHAGGDPNKTIKRPLDVTTPDLPGVPSADHAATDANPRTFTVDMAPLKQLADEIDAHSVELDQLNPYDGNAGSIAQVLLANFARKIAGMIRKVCP